MDTKNVIDYLLRNEKPYLEITTFSKYAGIYAIFYIGNDFPLLGNKVKKHQIIYIGKTESSQEKRDAKTHFASGKTGSSTLRKSIGSILCSFMDLKPIPRNSTDFIHGRLSHFKFEKESEEKITKWMKQNLALSFYEYPKSKNEIDNLETAIINKIVPILNISKNSSNHFKEQLQQLRKNCARTAHKINQDNKVNKNETDNSLMKISPVNNNGKYISLWISYMPQILIGLLKSDKGSFQLNKEKFTNAGNRKRYSFNLEYINGKVSNNISGSAVARDLAKVLENSNVARTALKNGHTKIRMDNNFCLYI